MLKEVGLFTSITNQLSHAQKLQTREGRENSICFVNRRQNVKIRQGYSDKIILKAAVIILKTCLKIKELPTQSDPSLYDLFK
tara:strand:- start:1716 stop:1961 length:246 start_codon:yes stop_codon:yes gene_type:complete